MYLFSFRLLHCWFWASRRRSLSVYAYYRRFCQIASKLLAAGDNKAYIPQLRIEEHQVLCYDKLVVMDTAFPTKKYGEASGYEQ